MGLKTEKQPKLEWDLYDQTQSVREETNGAEQGGPALA
jgi:hypothetical protein